MMSKKLWCLAAINTSPSGTCPRISDRRPHSTRAENRTQEVLYLRRPTGLDPSLMPPLVKLNKCIYGLKQAAYEWRILLDTTLRSIGFIPLQSDKCIYKLEKSINDSSHRLFIGVYVDDILCLGTNSAITTWFHETMSKHFTITINPSISSFLGMQVEHDIKNKIITISQPGYVESILERFQINQNSSKLPSKVPFSNYDIDDTQNIPLSKTEQTLFMKIVGSLLFLSTRSRPDISFHVNYLSLFMKSATVRQLHLAKRVLQYIGNSKHLSLQFHGKSGINFHVFVDSSYASHDDRKSHYGFSIHLNNLSGSCITVSKKAKLLALSSTEAEYLALFEASKTIMWLRQFLKELGYPQTTPTLVHEDNKSTITIISNGNDKGRTKHMDIRYHYVRELVQRKQITVTYCPSSQMTADMLTKPLDIKTFLLHRTPLLGNLVCGGVLT